MLDDEAGRIARQQVAAPAVDGAARGLDPVDQFGLASSSLSLASVRTMSTSVEARSAASRSASVSRIERHRARTQARFEIGERGLEQAGVMVSPGANLKFAQRLAREVERVGEPGDGRAGRRRVLLPFAEAPASVMRWAARLPESTDDT